MVLRQEVTTAPHSPGPEPQPRRRKLLVWRAPDLSALSLPHHISDDAPPTNQIAPSDTAHHRSANDLASSDSAHHLTAQSVPPPADAAENQGTAQRLSSPPNNHRSESDMKADSRLRFDSTSDSDSGVRVDSDCDGRWRRRATRLPSAGGGDERRSPGDLREGVGGSAALPAETAPADVEAWLDDHPDFTNDFFMRKATRQMVDAWLISHALTQSLQESASQRQATSVPSSRVTSGSVTPVRKISAHEFERGGTLKPILTTTVDGAPTFLTETPPSGSRGRLRSRPRPELQRLDEKELIFELVKDICNDLDVCSLCHKILQSVSTLTRADRCSLFLVRGERESNNRHLVAQLFDVSSHSKLEETKRELRMPWGAGIAGFVAEQGQTVNVADAYQDRRFNQEVDASTGYKTQSLLCMPIKDSGGEVLGVAQAVNKQGGGRFSSADEQVFASYLQFCGIGLRNAQLYERSQLENKRNEVLLDLARILLEEQSTIERLVQRILVHAASFLQCQRCQVLLVDDTCQGTFSRAFDIEAADLAKEDDLERRVSPHEGRFPIHVGISGQVATTGRALNIADVQSSPLFDADADEGSSVKHQSVLCLPIISPANRTIGVIQLVNKCGGLPFSKNDEHFLEAFAIFCGIGITNTHMFEKATTAVAKQQVTMEVLSYHATAPLGAARRLQSTVVPSARFFNLESFHFDDERLTDDDTLRACLRMALDARLLERFRIDQLTYIRWLMSVRKNYRPVTYHNWRHAFNVCQMMYTILQRSGWWALLGDLECLALLIACLCHDLDHRGTTNSFQAKVSSPLAQLYSTSTMERHHFDRALMILNTQGVQILANLRSEEYSRLVRVVESAIISTDLAVYFRNRPQFFSLAEGGNFDWRIESHRAALCGMAMTACDVAAIAKPWPIQKRVAQLVASEFFEQGDIEKTQLHIEPMAMMDRAKRHKLPDMQVDFIDSICLPVYQALARISSALQPLVHAVQNNRQQWQQQAAAAARVEADVIQS